MERLAQWNLGIHALLRTLFFIFLFCLVLFSVNLSAKPVADCGFHTVLTFVFNKYDAEVVSLVVSRVARKLAWRPMYIQNGWLAKWICRGKLLPTTTDTHFSLVLHWKTTTRNSSFVYTILLYRKIYRILRWERHLFWVVGRNEFPHVNVNVLNN